jgi:hypothetical protein
VLERSSASKTIGTIGTAGTIGTGFFLDVLNAISRFKAMEGLGPQVKRKILSAIPDDSRDLIAKRYKMNTAKRGFSASHLSSTENSAPQLLPHRIQQSQLI